MYGSEWPSHTPNHNVPPEGIFAQPGIIGCGIDFTTHNAFFTKNGSLIGELWCCVMNAIEFLRIIQALSSTVSIDVKLYPSVGLRHPDEFVHANF
jgi:hypothetical protein